VFCDSAKIASHRIESNRVIDELRVESNRVESNRIDPAACLLCLQCALLLHFSNNGEGAPGLFVDHTTSPRIPIVAARASVVAFHGTLGKGGVFGAFSCYSRNEERDLCSRRRMNESMNQSIE